MTDESLKTRNRAAIVRWLNHYLPERFAGSPDPDQLFDDNKKESRALLKVSLLDTIDDPLLRASDSLLWHLFFDWLPTEDSEAATACRFSLLNPNNAGGMVELERWEKMDHEDAREAAKHARRGLGKVVKVVSANTAAEKFARFLPSDEDERAALTEAGGIALAVGEDERCETVGDEMRHVAVYTVVEANRRIARSVQKLQVEGYSEDAAVAAKAEQMMWSEEKVWEAVREARGEPPKLARGENGGLVWYDSA